MADLILTIGDKNLSSWSMRPWLLLKQADIPFREQTIKLDQPETRKKLLSLSPSGLVPVLSDGDTTIWDSLAIAEYLNDHFPEKQLWPSNTAARAVARSITAEMHSGFSALRSVWPMNFTRLNLQHLTSGGVQRDINRIDEIWTTARQSFGQNGDFLFGEFSIADAFYAPVVSRFMTYGPVALSVESQRYLETMTALPAYQEWGEGAFKEIC